MDPNTFPTKGNLIAAKNSLGLAYMGYGLMDKKRNILIRELMELIDEAKGIQSEIDSTFREAYAALQKFPKVWRKKFPPKNSQSRETEVPGLIPVLHLLYDSIHTI